MRSIPAVVLLLIVSTAFAGETVVPSTITRVTVFLYRAQVERSAEAKIAQGDQTIIVRNLPNTIFDHTVRVAARGTADASILEVKVDREYLAENTEARVAALRTKIDSVNDALRELNDKMSVINAERDFVNAQKNPVTGGTKATAAELAAMVRFVESSLTQLAADARTVDRAKGKLQDRLAALTKEMEDIRSQAGTTRKRALVVVHANTGGTIELTLSYMVANAGWFPSYDARVTTADGKIAWTMYGTVQQSTGENWEGVPLTLSTAKPQQNANIPELAEWNLQPAQPAGAPAMGESSGLADNALYPRAKGFRTSEVIVDDTTEGSGIAKKKDIAFRGADIQNSTLATSFTVSTAMDVPSDGKPHKAMIVQSSFDAAIDRVAVPRFGATVYLRAKGRNGTDAPWLAGEASVFVDNAFVATARVPIVVPGDSLTLSLGTDDAVTAKRGAVKKVQLYEGLLSKTYKWEYVYVTTVTNNARTPVVIAVQDHLPISQNEKIVVETVSLDPSASRDDKGILTWRLTLAPGEHRDITVRYSVEYPRDMVVPGIE